MMGKYYTNGLERLRRAIRDNYPEGLIDQVEAMAHGLEASAEFIRNMRDALNIAEIQENRATMARALALSYVNMELIIRNYSLHGDEIFNEEIEKITDKLIDSFTPQEEDDFSGLEF
jgi:hypothetical protein